jgi:RNA polymerase sigma-70 factor (ECF subfamily)
MVMPAPQSSIVTRPQRLPRRVQDHLGQELGRAYAAVSAAPIPHALLKLIERLERALTRTPVQASFKQGLMAAIPNLRAYAISLTGNADRADDLVQDTILRAWDKHDSFQAGTNLNAWLFTILRNGFHSQYRKKHREVEDGDGSYADSLRTLPDQLDHLQMQELRAALAQLSPDQREALLLVGAEGLAYEEAAQICGCAVGTIKSRVNRARARLAELMRYESGGLGADGVMQAAISRD